MRKNIKIENKEIGTNCPTFIIAEMSGNHNKDIKRALNIVEAAAEAGVDAIKLQTYTPDTITMDCDNEYFSTQKGSLWEGMTLHQLYEKAYTPWDWHKEIFEKAKSLGLICFSSPFDHTAVDFLETLNVPAYKIASYEINDIPLIKKVAATGKPIIMSTGIATLTDIELAVKVCKEMDNHNIILLKCTSAYPSPYGEMNLNVIPHMAETFECITGLSDHSYGTEIAIAAVAKGAKVIEKHLTLSREEGGVDADFSMEPTEFCEMVKQIRNVEAAMGTVTYSLTMSQMAGKQFARSLFVVVDVKKGEEFNVNNIRSIRPGNGLHPIYYEDVLGRRATRNIKAGTPLSWEMFEK